MLAVTLLTLPVVAALLLAKPAVRWSLNPGTEIMTASNYSFQSDTFSTQGAIGSVAGDPAEPMIITGSWSLEVQGSVVAGFSTNLTMGNASGADFWTVELSNLRSTEVIVDEKGTALIKGMLDVTINATEKIQSVDATIALANMRALNITLSESDYLDQSVYGTANPPTKNRTSVSRPHARRQRHTWKHY